MSDVRDENKAPKTNEDDRAAKGNMQAPLVKKEKNLTYHSTNILNNMIVSGKRKFNRRRKDHADDEGIHRSIRSKTLCKNSSKEKEISMVILLQAVQAGRALHTELPTAALQKKKRLIETKKVTVNFPMSWLGKKKKRESPAAIAESILRIYHLQLYC
ncbi:Adenylosuccinate synthetase [Trichinella spiralis]|uniref:Adenylosuccinate synthetase n=1 Tax=Trichinella spiralis TaxID=6334 RepID=A0ABR3K1V2_TRISP